MTRFILRWVRRLFRDDQHRQDLNFLRGVSIFHGMTARQLGRIRHAMQKRSYRAGEVLFSEGQVGRAVFVIGSGQVELRKRASDGKERSLGVLGPGQVFGEMALLESRARTASAVVLEDGDIHLLYTATLESLIKRYPATGVKLLRNIASMLSSLLRRTNEQLNGTARMGR